MKDSSAINTIMPTLQVDQTGLIYVAVVDLLVLLGMLWAIYSQSCRLAAMRGKLGGLESQQTTEKTPATTSPAPDEKSSAVPATTSDPKLNALGAPPPAHLPIRSLFQEHIPWFNIGDSIKGAGPASPGEWDFSFIVPSTKGPLPPSLCLRARESPEGGRIGLEIDRVDDERTVVRMRLVPGQGKRDGETGSLIDSAIKQGVVQVVVPSCIWVHLCE